MRIFHTLLWAFVALACAAPTCDTHDGGLGSGSSATTSPTSPTSTGSAKQHEDVVHAMESVTGAKLGHPASTTKPTKPKSSTVRSDGNGGGGNYREAPPSPPPPPEPTLPASGRRIGQECVAHEQCASGYCEVD
ncbi:MAG TPA: hypothetical protein VF403_10555, partial [Kofleriaceae bacterium]